MGVKARVGGAWVPIAMVVEESGSLETVSDTALVDLNGGILSDITVTETAVTAALSPTGTPTLNLAPGASAASNGTIVSASANFTVTRPTGTASGDLMVLVFYGQGVTAPTITGWTLKDGPSTAFSGLVAFMYSRVADLTATDTPTVTYANGTPAASGWMILTVKAATAIGTPVMNVSGGVTAALTGTPITAAANGTLMLSIAMTISGRTLSSTTWVLDVNAPTGNYMFIASHQVYNNGEVSGAPVSTINTSTSVHGVYTVAIT